MSVAGTAGAKARGTKELGVFEGRKWESRRARTVELRRERHTEATSRDVLEVLFRCL